MGTIVLICGPPFSGKSTLSSYYVKGKTHYIHFDYGELIVKFSSLTSKYEVIRTINHKSIYNIDYKIISYLRDISNYKNILLELHPVTLTKVGLLGFTLEQLYLLKGIVRAIIYIDIDKKDMIKMMENDSKKRPNYSLKNLDIINKFSKYYTSIYSVILSVPLYVIKNEYGKINDILDEFSRAVDLLLGE